MADAPEARQCQTEDDFQFGSVAVKAGDNRWGVMSPANGGHWTNDAEVKDWPVVTAPAPEPEPAPAKAKTRAKAG